MVNKIPAPEARIGDQHKLLGLDHLRTIAILYVLCFHYQFFGHPAWVNKIGNFGWTGVDLFFVLSGFLISGQLFNAVAKGKPVSLAEFFIKRIFRILPPFLFVLLLYVAFPIGHEWGKLSPIWKYLTFTLNFGQDLKRFGTFSHAWSLCVEEQFYLILPLIFWLFLRFKTGKNAGYLLAILFIAGFVIRFLNWHYLVGPYAGGPEFGLLWNRYIYYPTYNRLDGLLVGVGIAGVFTFYPNVKIWVNRYNNQVMIFGLALITMAWFICTPQDNFYTCMVGFPLISMAYGLILAAVVSPSNIFYRLKFWLTSKIAMLSYSIYLIHKIVIHLTQMLLVKVGMDKDSNLMLLACLLASVAAALLMRYTIEKPSMKLRDKVLKKCGRKELSKESRSDVHTHAAVTGSK